jgi:hypothetical protein
LKKVGGEVAAQTKAVLARRALALLAGLLALLIALTGTSSGSAPLVLAQASGSPSSGTSGPTIQLLNPTQGYDPVFSPSGDPDSPKLSDKFDGIDRAYHVVASVVGAPSSALVEAYLQYPSQNEITVGTLTPVVGSADIYEFFWEIPDSLPDGEAVFRVRLYDQSSGGPVEKSADEVTVSMEQHAEDPPFDTQQADETIELTWPSQNGSLGFYKPKGGVWRTVIEGTTSSREPTPQNSQTSAPAVGLAYSTSAPGKEPVFTSCVSNATGGGLAADGRRPFRFVCALAGNTLPTAVTAIAAIAEEPDNPQHSGLQSMDSADVHRVQPYVQTPDQMAIKLIPLPGSGTTDRARRLAGSGCLNYFADVTDQLKRPVVGANVDIHIEGPDDNVQFGDDATAADLSGSYKNPEKNHSVENAADCDTAGADFGEQGEHNVPGNDDIKHRESVGGTGVSGGGGAGPGQWRFQIDSGTVGFTNITAWVDDADLPAIKDPRPEDSDTLDPGEAVATARAQWYGQAPTIDFVPVGSSGAVGTCHKFLLRARSGSAPIPGINLDVHASGPNNDLDFCDPGDGTPHRAPDLGEHDSEDSGESGDKATTPKTQHTEGETDDAGNFVLGITSPGTGDTTITAWLDGEKDFDNDVQGTAEPTAGATMTWATTANESKISFINPSSYGDVSFVSNKTDADTKFHIVTRVDSAIPVQGVEIQLGTGTGADFEKTADLGPATQVAGTDTWELAWAADAEDASYTLRAHVIGTSSVADQEFTLNSASSMDPTDRPDETVEITRPLNASVVPFSKGSTPVEGVASAGADALDLFYTKVGGNKTPVAADWISCGYVDLAGAATVQPFKGTCKLAAQDQAFQITGIAALTFDCLDPVPGNNCDGTADPDTGIRTGANDSGDAHRVFGLEASPLVGLSPAENEANSGACAKFVMKITDQSGQALSSQNVDVHLTGPGDTPNFCSPADGSASPRRAPDQGGHSVVSGHDDQGAHVADGPDTQHAEGETNGQGRFIFGVQANESGDSQIEAWVDQNDDDVRDSSEGLDTALMHWVGPNSCTEIGTTGDDVLTGTARPDRICGRGGNDVIRGKGGNDVLLGSGGADVVKGGGGRDRVNGGSGNDRLFGNGGNDALKGSSGVDVLNGGGGRDSCQTGPGRDKKKNCESGGAHTARMVRGGTA